MIEFQELLELCKLEAIASKVSPTEQSVWRSLCRDYSKAFHTPLHLVLEMEPHQVILAIFEEQMEDQDLDEFRNLENLMDVIRGIEDPEYDAKKSKEQEEFDRQAEEEEEQRVKSGRAVHPSLQRDLNEKRLLEKQKENPENRPTQGSINLSYLADQDSEG